MFPLSGLIDQAHAPEAEPVRPPPPVFAPKPGPGARNIAAQSQVERELSGIPQTEFDESDAPDYVQTATKLTGDTDPIRVGRVAAVLDKYGQGAGVDAAGQLAAAQSDWSKAAHLFRNGQVADPDLQSKWDRLADLPDDEAQSLGEFVRRVNDMTQDVHSKDWKMDGGLEVEQVETATEGPVIHLKRNNSSKSPAFDSAKMSMPTRMPFVSGGSGGVFVTPDGEVGVVAKPDATEFRQLHPMVLREDGLALWAPKDPVAVGDVGAMVSHATMRNPGSTVEKWTAAAFGRMHPARRPTTTVMVDVPDGMPLKRLRQLGEIVDPGQPAVVMFTNEEGDRQGSRARRIGINVEAGTKVSGVVAEASLWGGKLAAVYSTENPGAGLVQAKERMVTDGVTFALVRHASPESDSADAGVWVAKPVEFTAPLDTPTHLLPNLSDWVKTLKKDKSVLIIPGDETDLLPAARALHLLRRVGLEAVVETEHKGRKVRLLGA